MSRLNPTPHTEVSDEMLKAACRDFLTGGAKESFSSKATEKVETRTPTFILAAHHQSSTLVKPSQGDKAPREIKTDNLPYRSSFSLGKNMACVE